MAKVNQELAFKLSDGTYLPWVAWGNGTGDAKKTAIESGKIALEAGIRHIDTAQLYENEKETGIAIETSKIPREEVYVTSKLSPKADDGKYPPVPPSEVRDSIQGSLDRLGFVPDLYLIHSPFVPEPGQLKAVWKILEDLKDEGKLKSIGVSNFRPQDLEAILDGAKHKPVVNQLELHPYTLAHLEPLLELQEKHGILTTSYGALTPLLRHPTGGPLKPVLSNIAERLAKKYNAPDIDSLTVLFLWARAKKIGVVTASGNEERIKGLAKVYHSSWELDPEDVEEISRVGKTIHFRHYREHMEKDFPLPNLPSQ
ncbi:conjugated polyketone reductase C1 [Coprinopsis cinerea okayama7|uniref:Conjugated polyketone reductase C1 n=1 Tax=Coprinopsis cinerea (strain Okayama-7 / 130 / ATCC MYA-4618 / FGSC 9003) TaxID=240176 RepID=A8NJY9_COPC7|nr:conjugated polyketone reductase C1 [Coprinopsis cinerea okayama7\|eukprot:XP_001834325.1 conjugated polyketone reductase C1 [Coprinopsis cinerea okayama7\